MSDHPTLEAQGARIDLLGQPLLAQLSLHGRAERLALLGDWSALFRLFAGEAELSAGSLNVAGEPVPRGVEQGKVGVMRLDPQLPVAWSAEQLLATSAELCGLPAKSAGRNAFQVLERLGLAELAPRRIAHLQLAERRALLVAHAVLTDPLALCLEEPLAALDTHGELAVMAVIERASAGRRLLVAVGDPGATAATRRLVQSCGERFGLAAGVAVPLSAETSALARVTATICKNHQAFAAALAARGIAAHPTHEAGVLGSLTSPVAGPCWRYLVELPTDSSAPILDAALETDAGLVELIPLFS
ncbi:MAG: transporter ATP-binding protein [Polyangiaceae bacterium]|nr:transporter ATP-binding protein [Polyangiaceae bacterium]